MIEALLEELAQPVHLVGRIVWWRDFGANRCSRTGEGAKPYVV